jgi:hypothetical protein
MAGEYVFLGNEGNAIRLALIDRAPLVRFTDRGGRRVYVNANLIECIASASSADGEITGSQIFLTGWTNGPVEVKEPPETVYTRASAAQRRV